MDVYNLADLTDAVGETVAMGTLLLLRWLNAVGSRQLMVDIGHGGMVRDCSCHQSTIGHPCHQTSSTLEFVAGTFCFDVHFTLRHEDGDMMVDLLSLSSACAFLHLPKFSAVSLRIVRTASTNITHVHMRFDVNGCFQSLKPQT